MQRIRKMRQLLRYKIAERDNYICQLCLLKIEEEENLSIDHIIPKSKGGTNAYNNLQIAHKACNSLKSSNEQKHPEFYQERVMHKTIENRPYTRKKVRQIKNEVIFNQFKDIDLNANYATELYNEIQRHGMNRLSYNMFKNYFDNYLILTLNNSSVTKITTLIHTYIK